MILPTIVSFVLRFLFRRSSLPPSAGSIALYVVTFLPALFLYKYLVKIGTARRDPTTGTLISYGEDLSQQGVTEWCFDILYITCGSHSCIILLSLNTSAIGACQIGSGAFGEWFWWLYMIVRPCQHFLFLIQTYKYLKDSIVRYFQALDNRDFTHDLGRKRASNICREPNRKRFFSKQTAGKTSEATRTWGHSRSPTN